MCGLYGIINSKPAPFHREIFTVLGIANDRRGGDSCGIFIDGKVEYGIGKQALFENFFWDSNLLNNTVNCQIVLGHDRKASVGAVTLEKAHPILIKNDKGNTDFVLIHNGTLHNYEDLAEKYISDIDYSKLSDSQVLALILYNKGFDVLSEYIGGAAFVAVDYRSGEPVTYLFKGASKNSSTSTEISVERPLYFTFDQDRLIFSSIPSYLCALVGDEVYEAEDNKIYEYIDGKLYFIKTVDRSKCQQTKIYTYSGSGYSPYSSYYKNFQYLIYKDNENIYTDESGKPLNGKYRVSEYGRLYTGDTIDKNVISRIYPIFFFYGIPFRDKFNYNLVKRAFKKSGMEINDFLNKNQCFIRFYSISPQYFENNLCRAAVSECGNLPFTGSIPVLGKCVLKVFKCGVYSNPTYTSDYRTSFEMMKLCAIM